MIRLAKLTDYGIALGTHFARHEQASLSARELAESTHIPLPTVSKLLKVLSGRGLLQSQRGVRGGYTLSRPAQQITVADMVCALEGPVSITECTEDTTCSIEHSCSVKPHWQKINGAIRAALDGLTLADMAQPELPISITRRGTLPIARA